MALDVSKPARSKPASSAPVEMNLDELLGPEGEPEGEPEAAEYSMAPEEMVSALEEMGYVVTPPASEASAEEPSY